MLRRHAYPTFGTRQLGTIRPGEVQSWVKKLSTGSDEQRGLASNTVGVVHGLVAAIFKAAVRDRKLPSSPCDGIKLPKQEPRQVVPLATSAVRSLAEVVPPRYSASSPSQPAPGCGRARRSASRWIAWTSCGAP